MNAARNVMKDAVHSTKPAVRSALAVDERGVAKGGFVLDVPTDEVHQRNGLGRAGASTGSVS